MKCVKMSDRSKRGNLEVFKCLLGVLRSTRTHWLGIHSSSKTSHISYFSLSNSFISSLNISFHGSLFFLFKEYKFNDYQTNTKIYRYSFINCIYIRERSSFTCFISQHFINFQTLIYHLQECYLKNFILLTGFKYKIYAVSLLIRHSFKTSSI